MKERRQLNDHYARQVERLTALLARLRRRSRSLVAAQIVTFVAMIGFVAAYATTALGAWTLLVAALMLLLYVVARCADGANSDRMRQAEALRTVNERELQYLKGDFSPFADGKGYVDAEHPFTFDLDVFGRESLFQRINRTVTTGGSDGLAACLMHDHGEQTQVEGGRLRKAVEAIESRRRAIDALAPLTDWRTRFVAVGVRGSIDTARLTQALAAVRGLSFPRWPLSGFTRVLAVLSLLCFYALVALAACALVPASVAVAWGAGQLFVAVLLCQGTLKRVGQALDQLREPMRQYLTLIRLIGELKDGASLAQERSGHNPNRSEELSRLLLTLDGAEEAFAEAEKIVGGLCRRNDVGIVLFDTFALNDIFLVRRFLRWQGSFLHSIDAWTACVSRIDALVSMATFRHNEPKAVKAEIVESDDVVLEAHGLWHPFLGEKAVSNDFALQDGHYYIITGANMAGKSTFLRALGMNYILAMNGLPVFAESLRVSVFSLFTNMRTTDDLTRGISYFNAELLRLQQLIAHCQAHRNTLIILDEILKGTNSADKLAGSRLFLEFIATKRVTGVIATHDLELSRMADDGSGRFHNHCFEIGLDTRVTYSYKLTEGVARNRNATYLLREILMRG